MGEPDAKRQRLDQQGEEEQEEVERLGEVADQITIIQGKIDDLNEELSDKVLAIEQQYSLKRKPMFLQRNELLKKIPGFWATTLTHHAIINQSLTEEDAEILQFCNEVVVEDYEDIKMGYKIVFRFNSENPYFSDAELIKSFRYVENNRLQVSSTTPDWRENFAPGDAVADPEAEGGERTRDYSFFQHWFGAPDGEFEVDYHDLIADSIREEIWPNPWGYYASEPEPMDPAEFDEGEEGDEEGDDGEGGDFGAAGEDEEEEPQLQEYEEGAEGEEEGAGDEEYEEAE